MPRRAPGRSERLRRPPTSTERSPESLGGRSAAAGEQCADPRRGGQGENRPRSGAGDRESAAAARGGARAAGVAERRVRPSASSVYDRTAAVRRLGTPASSSSDPAKGAIIAICAAPVGPSAGGRPPRPRAPPRRGHPGGARLTDRRPCRRPLVQVFDASPAVSRLNPNDCDSIHFVLHLQ